MLVLNNLIIVKPDPKPTTTEGGIALPDQAQEPPRHGIIKYLSDSIDVSTSGLQVGMKIYYPHYSAIEIGPTHPGLIKIDIKEAWFAEAVS